MQRNFKRAAVLTVGIILIALGVIGLVLPFLQGIIFLIIGFLLVSLCFPRVRYWMRIRTARYHRTSAAINKMEKWITKLIGEI